MQKIKKFLNSIWNEFVYGGHLLSLGAVSIVFTASVLLNTRITWDFLLIVYFWTQSVYLYNRLKEINKDYLTDRQRTEHLKKNFRYLPLIIIFFFIAGFAIIIFSNKIQALIFGLFLFLLSILYSLSLKKLTKKIIAFKSFFVPLIWASMVLFLALYYKSPFSLSFFLITIFIYLKLFIHEEFFNIKDSEGDKKEGLQTFAIILGEKKLLNILQIINAGSSIPILIGVYYKILPLYSFAIFLTIPYTFYFLKKQGKEKKIRNSLYNIIADGEYLLWSPFVLIIKYLI
jgi:4-hydroxybenzoate polyprenyltransferase